MTKQVVRENSVKVQPRKTQKKEKRRGQRPSPGKNTRARTLGKPPVAPGSREPTALPCSSRRFGDDARGTASSGNIALIERVSKRHSRQSIRDRSQRPTTMRCSHAIPASIKD